MLTAHHRANRRSAAFRLASNNFGDKYLITDDDVVGPVAAGVEHAPPAADGALAWAVIAKPTNTKLQNYKITKTMNAEAQTRVSSGTHITYIGLAGYILYSKHIVLYISNYQIIPF